MLLVKLTQLRSEDPILLDAKNIKQCLPDEFLDSENPELFRKGTKIELYSGEEWAVKETAFQVFQIVNSARKGML